MAVNLSPVGGVAAQFFTSTGAVLTGGKLYTYAAGTTTPVTTYTNSQGNVAWTNPVELDAAGRVPGSGEIWLTDGIIYKFVLKTSTDTLIATYDNITGINSNSVSYSSQQEIVTATAGQTVFSLTINYQPGTNSLSVFVDGVNQYGPGAQYSYVETDANTVTFNSGLHVGAEVKFTTTQQQGAGAVDASQVSYDPPFTGSVATNVEAKLAQYVSVKDFGAVGDGLVDDTAAIQAAFDNAKNVYFPSGIYKLTNTLTITQSSPCRTLKGDGYKSVIYQTGASEDCLQVGTLQGSLVEGLTISDLSIVAADGARYGLHLNEVVRSYFSNLYIMSPSADIYTTAMILNTWDGIKLSYAPFNEDPISGITIPSPRQYGLYVASALGLNSYTTNAWNGLVVEGHTTGGMYVDGGSTNTYTNLCLEGETGYGMKSSAEWDVFNGLYFEAIGGNALELTNTQKITINSLFSNTESVVLSNCLATVINSRADWTIGVSPGGITFINSDGTLTYLSGSNNGTNLRLINSSLFDLTHKVQLGSGFGMAGGDTSGFSAVAPRALVDRVSYTQTPSFLASYGDKVWFSQGNINGNLGAKPGGYAGLIVSNRVETTLSSAIGNGATSIPVTSSTGMRIGDVLAVRNTVNNGYGFGVITAISAGPVISISGTGIPFGAPSGYEVFAIRWDLFGETCGFDVLDAVSATPTVGEGRRNFVIDAAGFNITNFTDGLIGQEIRLFPNVAGTIVNGATVQLAGGVNFVMAAGDSLTLIKKPDGVWYEVCRSVN